MKKLLCLLLFAAAGCHKDADVLPGSGELEIVTQGRNRDCGVAQVRAIDSAQVRQVLGRKSYAPIYLALQLDTALWASSSHTLLVRIRKPGPGEGVACTAMGPGYAPFVVTSARIKPGSN